MNDEDPLSSSISPSGEGSLLALRVVPNARRWGLEIRGDGTLLCRVAAPAVEGAANAALVRWLAREALGVSRGRVRLEKGEHSRRKLLSVELSPGELRGRLAALLDRTR